MNPELPSVSTFRVEKPGKSKFAPSIAGRKTAGSAAAPSARVASDLAPRSREPERTREPESEQEKTALADAGGILSDGDGEESQAEEQVTEPLTAKSRVQGKKIESIQMRRQEAAASSKGPAALHTPEDAIKLPDPPRNAASIAVDAAVEQKTRAQTSQKRTMAFFLQDSGEGREMPSSGATGAASGTASPGKGRRVVNLKNIKAPRSVTTALAPQVRVINGAIVYDENAAAMSTPAITDDLDQQLEYIDEDDEHGRHLTSATYAKRTGSNRWNAAETHLFYEALAMCGTDFSMIQTFFPHRTRAQIKGKYKLEERSDLNRVHSALRTQRPLDPTFKDRVQAALK